MICFSARILYWKTKKNNKKYYNVFSAHSFKMIFLYDIVRMEKNDTT
jgi:hypothetical protein